MKQLDTRTLITVTGGSESPQTRQAAASQFTSALGAMSSFWQSQPIISGRK